MKILARLLSHGFAIAVVLLLAIGFIHRGELFPDIPMPAFLGIERPDDAVGTETSTAAEDAAAPAREAVETAAGAAGPAESAVTEPVIPEPAVADDEPGSGQPGADGDTAAPVMPSAGEPAAVIQPTPPPPATEMPVHIAPDRAAEAGVAPPVPAETAASVPPPGAAAGASVGMAPDPVPQVPGEAGTSVSMPAPGMDVPAMQPPVPAAQPIPEQPVEAPVTEPDSPSWIPAPGPGTTSAAPADRVAAIPSGETATAPRPAQEVPVPGYIVPPVAPQATTAPTAAATALEPGTGAAAAPEPSRPYQILAAAREAYWMRDHDGAESLYQRLIALEPDNPDGYGELGNLYFSLGRWDDAASAYFEAGRRLAESGHVTEARNMLDVVRGLDDGRANELEEIITGTR